MAADDFKSPTQVTVGADDKNSGVIGWNWPGHCHFSLSSGFVYMAQTRIKV